MRKLRINHNEKGFTLIELMIVIAIIGILSAIAIPNFISYRNKTFCSAVESDAQSIAGAVADYFAIPSNTTVSKTSLSIQDADLSNGNTYTLTATDPNSLVSITVVDTSQRCPSDYTSANADWTDNPGADFTLRIQN